MDRVQHGNDLWSCWGGLGRLDALLRAASVQSNQTDNAGWFHTIFGVNLRSQLTCGANPVTFAH